MPTGQKLDIAALNPLVPLRWVLSVRRLWPITLTFFILSAAGEAYGIAWALWGSSTFHWNGLWIGLSLGTFGVCQTLAQAFLPGPAVSYLGERKAILLGLGSACVALTVMAFATQGWMVFAIMPIFALTGIGTPALQSYASRQVSSEQQGQFQGVLSSAVSLASIVSPLAFSSVYFAVKDEWPGAVWLSVIVVYALAIPLVMRLRMSSDSNRSDAT